MKKLSTEEYKQRLINTLLQFQKICDEKNIPFYLAGGTLLGAVRHKGFIPWDDDIDVFVFREDYNRLVNYLKNGDIETGDYTFAYIENGSSFYPFMKMLDNKAFIDRKYTEGGIVNLWIDVLPVDYLPESDSDADEYNKKLQKQRTYLRLYYAKLGEGKNLIRKLAKFVVVPFIKLKKPEEYSKNILKLAEKYSSKPSKYVGCGVWSVYGIKKERMLKEEFDKETEVEFEGYKFKTMSCWDKYLTNLYGNYMELPPVDKRVTHDIEVYVE